LAKKKPIEYTADSIDFDSYDELVFVSPVWGGKLNPYMKKFIEDHPIKNKKIKVIGASKGDNPGYVSSCEGVFDTTNQIQSISMRLPK
jgi:flavodoxin